MAHVGIRFHAVYILFSLIGECIYGVVVFYILHVLRVVVCIVSVFYRNVPPFVFVVQAGIVQVVFFLCLGSLHPKTGCSRYMHLICSGGGI